MSSEDILLGPAYGKLVRLPCKYVSGQGKAEAVVLRAIEKKLKESQQNVLPVIVSVVEEERYEAIANEHILEAAKKAKLDFVMCILADDAMSKQLEAELGQDIQLNLPQASKQEIAEFFSFLKSTHHKFKRINPGKVAAAIDKHKASNSISNIAFLTRLKCGIGKAKLPALRELLTV